MAKANRLTTSGIAFHEVAISGIDAMTADTDWSFGRHTHDLYGIGVIDRGGHNSASDRRRVEAGPGDMILVNPGEVHDGRPVGDNGRAWRILYVEPKLILGIQDDVTLSNGRDFPWFSPVITEAEAPDLQVVFDAFFRHVVESDKEASEASMLVLIARLLGGLGHRIPVITSSATGILRAKELILDDVGAELSLSRLSEVTGLSRYQLHRGFLREFGLTPHAYVTQARIAHARRLIRAGMPLAEAAAVVGFCDQSHLNRLWGSQFGIPPGEYAKRHSPAH
ncbi:AraC family transcriptional regulator [Dyella mobilis]|uniref:AraC family transcriptional regulator n=1 Tax=Dyella mobilis TaxID=1849582 RepID=A0ABS2KCB3_9GAMM|nr:AraC family transcriptional regulator [Dyella mobilis]MBM7128744.1 AraC family transcriptional regulator [Dyella mobilis]GLQ99072.1 transcriptional regulator [Dyella mobilis]